MITGDSDVTMAVQAMKAGASDFIEKPIGRDELFHSIDRALELSRDSSKLTHWREAAAQPSGRAHAATTRRHGTGARRPSQQEHRRRSRHQPAHGREPSRLDHEADRIEIPARARPIGACCGRRQHEPPAAALKVAFMVRRFQALAKWPVVSGRRTGQCHQSHAHKNPSRLGGVCHTYAYNDFAAAEVAASLGKTNDASLFYARSRKSQYLWNPDVESDGFKGFIMPRKADGTSAEFDAKKYPGSWRNYFYEASSWTYSYFAPHQPGRLIELMGGPDQFIARLQHALDAKLLELDNEPSFLIPQLFHHVGRPDLAVKSLQKIITDKFSLRGYPGDDDSGAMSSYYIWAKLGLFPNAGQDLYYLNGPPSSVPSSAVPTGDC